MGLIYLKAIGVIGTHKSGKTTLVENLVRRLVEKGFRVATIKSIYHARIDIVGKDSWRHGNAGAEETILYADEEIFRILRHKYRFYDVVNMLRNYDYLVLEGLSTLKNFYGVKIITAKSIEEARNLIDSLTIAVSGLVSNITNKIEFNGKIIPVYSSINDIDKILDLVLENSFEPPYGYNCGECRYKNCLSLAESILRGEAKPEECVYLKRNEVILNIDGKSIGLNPFVQDLLKNILMGFISTLKGVDNPREVFIKISL